jgi:hypothetical protein
VLTIIYPKDYSTEFLLRIYSNLLEKFEPELVKILYIEANDNSYSEGVKHIESIDENSLLLFMGHGQDDLLYGAEEGSFKKKPFVKRTEFKVFKGKYLFSLSCYSNELLRTSLGNSGIINSIGFGSLPTEMTEVDNNKRLKEKGITKDIIQRYKDILVELVTLSYSELLEKKLTFSQLSEYYLLLLNRKISEVILDDKTCLESKILADLLFQMKAEMVYL